MLKYPLIKNQGDFVLKELIKDFFSSFYAIFTLIWFFAGSMFVARTFKEAGLTSTWDKIQYICYGIGSSMLIGWVVCEICLYAKLSTGLAGALGGLASYIGASTISSLLLTYFKSKIGIKDDDNNIKQD